MLSERSSVDIHALKRQGMTISEIARRTHHDRKTFRGSSDFRWGSWGGALTLDRGHGVGSVMPLPRG